MYCCHSLLLSMKILVHTNNYIIRYWWQTMLHSLIINMEIHSEQRNIRKKQAISKRLASSQQLHSLLSTILGTMLSLYHQIMAISIHDYSRYPLNIQPFLVYNLYLIDTNHFRTIGIFSGHSTSTKLCTFDNKRSLIPSSLPNIRY